MITKAAIVRGKYLDSVKLMLISRALRELEGVADAVAILATPENRSILAATDMLVPEVETALDTDIVIVVKATDADIAQAAINQAETLIQSPSKAGATGSGAPAPRDIATAIQSGAPADLCLISVAGKYAAAEADKALDAGLHVMLFSDNVSIEDELRLKRKALASGLLMMGPDCGTAIVGGVPLGFANSVPRGSIGIVSASGTGLQEVSCGIARRGLGISQAFGTGGRDGKEEIGGLMLGACLDYLIADPDTQVIVMIAKPPCASVREALLAKISTCGKPVIVNFLSQLTLPEIPNMTYCPSLDGTAELACVAAGAPASRIAETTPAPHHPIGKGRSFIRGLYSGGTLCHEACEVYRQLAGTSPKSNITSDPAFRLSDPWHSEGDSFIDMGADDFTVGRPHPMIDFSLRVKKLLREASDPQTAVILMDVVLGWGAHPDPASELVPALQKLPHDLLVVIDVLGTETDPQHTALQASRLSEAGAVVFHSHHAAAQYAVSTLLAHRRN